MVSSLVKVSGSCANKIKISVNMYRLQIHGKGVVNNQQYVTILLVNKDLEGKEF